jgi:hypothetical protein
MPFPVLGSNSAVAGFEIDNSLRFNNPDDPNLSKTFSSAGNRRTFTISAWIKKGDTGTDRALIGQGGTSAGNPRGLIFVGSTLRFTSNTTGSFTEADVETNAKLRDHSAWYHLVVAVDTTQGTAANRIKLYINGEQQTSLAIATYPDQNFEMNWNNNVLHTVGRYPNNDAYHMDGYISEFYFIDGTQHTASDFGETNDNGVWIPKRFSGSYGTNGFKLEFKNSGALGTDTSGNGNDFTVNNLTATDQTTDTPTNNFCTMNPLDNFVQGSTFSEGNCQVVTAVSPNTWNTGTFGVANGKWYYELKVTELGETEGTNYMNVGWASSMATTAQESMSFLPYNYAYASDNGNVKSNNTSGTTHGATYGTDIIGVALDLENNTIAFSKNGLWADNSGNSDESNINGTISIQGASGTPTGFYFPSFGDNVQGDGMTAQLNFGNPPFAISSGNSDANGYGNFEYAVPSGYYALCTKNLAEYG